MKKAPRNQTRRGEAAHPGKCGRFPHSDSDPSGQQLPSFLHDGRPITFIHGSTDTRTNQTPLHVLHRQTRGDGFHANNNTSKSFLEPFRPIPKTLPNPQTSLQNRRPHPPHCPLQSSPCTTAISSRELHDLKPPRQGAYKIRILPAGSNHVATR